MIETAGALIQGIWGNGRIDHGVLVNLADRPDSVLAANRIDMSMRGSILMAGQIRDAETLRVAAEVSVRGLLVGSIFPSLLPAALELRYPIVVTDGFGNLPMNSAAYRLLSTNIKREVTLNAEPFDRYNGRRPEVIIPLPSETRPPEPRDVVAFAPGQTVRVRRQPATSLIGTIVSLPAGSEHLPERAARRRGRSASGEWAAIAHTTGQFGGCGIIEPLVSCELLPDWHRRGPRASGPRL